MNIKKSLKIDYGLAIAVGLLLLIGITILASVSAVFSLEKSGKTGYYFIHQMLYGFVPGIILGLIAFFLPLSFFKKWAFALITIGIVLMVMVFIPGLGITSGGAPRWLKLGFAFQPSEILKITFIIYLSSWLANKTKTKSQRGKDWKLTLIPFACILGFIFFLLYFQKNASTLGLLFLIAIFMYFFSGTPLWHILILAFMGAAGGLYMIVFEPYRINRVLVVLGVIKEPMGLGYQIKQSLITIGSGGIIGVGLGMSVQKFGKFLPQTMSDSIFAVFAEETGFIGCAILLFLFIFFFYRCMVIAKRSGDKFSQLFSMGMAMWICFQALINIGAMINIFPLTGIPLPFISYGGSHIIAELVGVGILFNISKHNQS